MSIYELTGLSEKQAMGVGLAILGAAAAGATITGLATRSKKSKRRKNKSIRKRNSRRRGRRAPHTAGKRRDTYRDWETEWVS